MHFASRSTLAALVALIVGGAAQAATGGSLLFNFRFDDTFDYPDVGLPLTTTVGTGFVRFAYDPGNGIYSLNDIGASNTSLFFDFGFTTFDLSSLVSDPDEAYFFITDWGNARRLYMTGFSDTGTGPFGGAPTFANGSFFLEFEPVDQASWLDSYAVGLDEADSIGGSYLALSAPEPTSIGLLALGAAGLVVARRRKRS